ncbi:MAG: hypothetical protein ACYCPT_09985 [Acidimicrobiales bacterium]
MKIFVIRVIAVITLGVTFGVFFPPSANAISGVRPTTSNRVIAIVNSAHR